VTLDAKIAVSALAPPISEQCAAKGLVATGMHLETVDKISSALTLAYIHSILTEAEVDRCRNRLLKAAKLRERAS
jgi:hypothetical protein